MLNIVFRTDASLQIGTGHVVRCLTLAYALRGEGAECTFVCRMHEGHMIDFIRANGFAVHVLPKPMVRMSFESDFLYTPWLGVDWQTDATQTHQVLGNKIQNWLVIDHYALDYRWHSVLRTSCEYLMVIDELANRQHNCDILLDQTYGSSAERYRGLVAGYCEQYHGPSYALLKPVYAELRKHLSVRDGKVRRVLIYFGGGEDALDLTVSAVRAFKSPELAGLKLDIVVGAAYVSDTKLNDIVTQHGSATIYGQLPDLANLMSTVDLAIGAAGATTWERCCMGLPSILVVCAPNQEAIGEAICKSGAAIIIYPGYDLVIHIREKVIDLCKDTAKYLMLSNNSRKICDGLGVLRISKKMISKSISAYE